MDSWIKECRLEKHVHKYLFLLGSEKEVHIQGALLPLNMLHFAWCMQVLTVMVGRS